MYKQLFDPTANKLAPTVQRISDNAFIPLDPANTDYTAFKNEVANGVELQDPDGNVMTQAEVNAFLETIP